MGAFDRLTTIFAGVADGIPAAVQNSKAPAALKMQWALEYATTLAALQAKSVQQGWTPVQLQMQIDAAAWSYIQKLMSYQPPAQMPVGPPPAAPATPTPTPAPAPPTTTAAAPTGLLSSLAQHKEQVIAGMLAIAGVTLVAMGVRK